MFISKKHQLAYFASPRIASNSVQNVLENAGLDDEDNVVFTLSNLSSPIDGRNIKDGSSEQVDALNKYHMTPTQAIENGYVTVEELRSYTTFGFVRDPLKRWVSRFFLAGSYGLWEGDPVSNMVMAIRHGMYEGNVELPLDFKWGMKDYFYHNEERVVTPYRLDEINSILPTIVDIIGGETNEIPNIQLGDSTPEEFRQPIETWMPNDCVHLLQIHYAKDIEFYESV